MSFPVRGAATYTREFNPPKHLGVDIFAERGAPVLAPDAGAVTFGTDPLGGNVANLKTSDGTRYYMAHLDGWSGASGRIVQAGETIGFVGDTGNARGKHPHLHFEVHAVDGQALDPYPLLDRVSQPEHKHPALPGVEPAPAPPPPTAIPATPSPAPAPATPPSSAPATITIFGVTVRKDVAVMALIWWGHKKGWRF